MLSLKGEIEKLIESFRMFYPGKGTLFIHVPSQSLTFFRSQSFGYNIFILLPASFEMIVKRVR